MLTTHYNKRTRFLALLCSALILFLSVSVSTTQISAKTISEVQDEISDLNDQQEQLKKEQAELKEKQEQLAKDLSAQQELKESYEQEIENVEEQLEIYQQQIDAVNKEIDALDDKISEKEAAIDTKNQEIADKEAEIEETNEEFKDRLDAMYIANSTNSTLSLLLGAQSFSEFLSATEVVKSISESDQKLLQKLDQQHQELEELKQQLENEKQELEDAKQEQETKKSDLVTVKAGYEAKSEELNDLYAKVGEAIVYIEGQQRENDAAIEESQSNISKLQQEAAQAQKEYEEMLASQGGGSSGGGSSSGGSGGGSTNPPTSSGYIWPLDGGHVTCEYGGYSGHRGVDLSTGVVGTKIFAAKYGKVVDVQNWNWGDSKQGMASYGRMVRIYHPDTGTYTRYAHCNSILVSEGDWVQQGQVIATMGNTGNSFGAHLHFEISTSASNNTRIDPLPYIT